MKGILAACAAVAVLAACSKPADRRDAETGFRESADTAVIKREMRDTAIIHHDTTISTDTVEKRGRHTVKTDTVKKP